MDKIKFHFPRKFASFLSNIIINIVDFLLLQVEPLTLRCDEMPMPDDAMQRIDVCQKCNAGK